MCTYNDVGGGGGGRGIDVECFSSLSLFMKPLRVMEKGTRNPGSLSTHLAIFNFCLFWLPQLMHT